MPRLTKWGLVLWVLAGAAFGACDGRLNKEGYFQKDRLRYRVASPDSAQWQQLKFADNDLAWVHQGSAHVLSINATCQEHGDPGLDVLTTHLLFGFSERTLKARTTAMLDGREAMLSNYEAKLDGVPVEIDVAVMKKDDCVHDFIYVSPIGRAQEHKPEFDRLLSQFTAEHF